MLVAHSHSIDAALAIFDALIRIFPTQFGLKAELSRPQEDGSFG